MLWLVVFLLFLIITFRFRRILEYLRECTDLAKERKYERELRKEWKKTFPSFSTYDLEIIFERYGLISPKEFILIQDEIYEVWIKSIEQIMVLLEHLSKILWRLIDLPKYDNYIREILRKQIKVAIDDEELGFAF